VTKEQLINNPWSKGLRRSTAKLQLATRALCLSVATARVLVACTYAVRGSAAVQTRGWQGQARAARAPRTKLGRQPDTPTPLAALPHRPLPLHHLALPIAQRQGFPARPRSPRPQPAWRPPPRSTWATWTRVSRSATSTTRRAAAAHHACSPPPAPPRRRSPRRLPRPAQFRKFGRIHKIWVARKPPGFGERPPPPRPVVARPPCAPPTGASPRGASGRRPPYLCRRCPGTRAAAARSGGTGRPSTAGSPRARLRAP
jgi:hypothetical protein